MRHLSPEARAARAARIQARFEWPVAIAALLVIPVLVIEGSDLEQPWPLVAEVLNWSIWLAFAAEFVVMLAVTPRRWRWIRDHPLEVAIVFLTPPFLPESMQAARAFRLLRVLQLIAAAKLIRALLSPEGVRDAAVLALMTVLGGGAAFAAVESGQDLTTWDGVWWAITTVTTVGYGDIRPYTDSGRLIAIVVMTVGIGFVAILTAAAAERFIRGRVATGGEADAERGVPPPGQEPRERLAEIRRRVDELERSLRRSEA